MSRLAHALFAVAIVSTALVAAAPAAEKSVRKASSLTQAKTAPVDNSKKLRRGKRQVVVQELPEEDEEELIREQLSELSDDQLAMLADIVQTEINRYDEEPQEQYEIVEIPDELLQGMVYPRERRVVPVMEIEDEPEDDETEEVPELVVIPEEVVEEALQEEQDDMELRMRIAEMANILNERATRRRNF